ncbi:LD-carboxypeptidase [Sphingomonas ginkgonis]|uniref:LD-carboxypeptidase n=1 Tax=Sphingomonas ginkgonis TaxID=2315330 RepID=A0A429VAF7_9SPHN|nr:LD-carboxypeptidase [Sphingomonas ginkgonis]RST30915.1 LD-carboxypeptidase [Sphingomonas ginkgonis]
MRIAVVAPSCTLKLDAAAAVKGIVAARGDADLLIHPQCFLSDGHFAGADAARLAAFREVAADPAIDAVWFARGGYGSNRIAAAAAADLPPAALTKRYVGYSDGGFLLAALHRAGAPVAHGPMVQDVARSGGEKAVGRTLDWLAGGSPEALEPGLGGPAFAFNLTVLSSLLGTALEPEWNGAELLIEDLAEHHYRIDRMMFHLTGQAGVRRLRGIRMGRLSDIPDNEPRWSGDAEAIVRDWCGRSGIPYLGHADIGHDAANRIVPFPLRDG